VVSAINEESPGSRWSPGATTFATFNNQYPRTIHEALGTDTEIGGSMRPNQGFPQRGRHYLFGEADLDWQRVICHGKSTDFRC